MSHGLLFAALSAVFNGTFGVFTKTRRARTVHPLITNYWISEGMGLSGLLLLAVPPRVFTPWGLLSGVLFVLSAAHAVTAISLVGLAVATGVWCGTAVVVSFAYGMLVAGDQVEHLGQAVAAISLTLAGIAGIAVASWIGGGGDGAAGEDAERGLVGGDSEASLLLGASQATSAAHGGGADAAEPWQERLQPRSRALLGLLAAVMAGAIGGLILAPMLAAPPEARGLPFVPSMALGAMILAPTIAACLACAAPLSAVSFTRATSSRAAGPGMAAGFCWNAGNCCCILAVTDPRVGLAVAMPIMQAGLFVAGCWGILLHREIRGCRALTVYFVSGSALVAGAALLAAAKGG